MDQPSKCLLPEYATGLMAPDKQISMIYADKLIFRHLTKLYSRDIIGRVK